MDDDVRLTRHSALSNTGLSRGDIRALERDGELARIRRGVYQRRPDPARTAESRHVLLTRATCGELMDGAVVSHLSAAVMHGLPLLVPIPGRVSVTRSTGGHGRVDTRLHLRLCPVADDETVSIQGVPVTSLARTVVDMARTYGLDQGVVLTDAALRAGLELADLQDCLGAARGRPGIGRARWVAGFADIRSESPGESVSRLRIWQADLPAPELQWKVSDEDGQPLFSDFAWPLLRTVGEFDGRIKYEQLVPPGRNAADVVMAEKRRENRLRAGGWWLVRWTWPDLADVHAFGRMMRNAFANAPRAA